MTDKQKETMKKRHLEFAAECWKGIFDIPGVSDKEKEHTKKQIPLLGRVPFEAGYEAALKDSEGTEL